MVPVLKSNIAIGFVNKEHYNLGSNVYAEIYHPEELDYRKIWAECKVVKKQFFNNPRKNAIPAFIKGKNIILWNLIFQKNKIF